MLKFIIKRDGRKEKFDSQKILSAITKAQDAADAIDYELAGNIENTFIGIAQ